MAKREIKTTLAIDGEKAFNKAVTEAGRSMRVMASEMKVAAAEFNLTGDEMDYLGRKSQNLRGQIDQQEAIIRALEGAISEAADAYGDASAKTDGYRIKLNNAQASMAKLKKELEDANREMTDLGRDAGRIGRQIEEGLGNAADDTSKKFDSFVNSLNTDVGDLKKMVSLSTFTDIGGKVLEGAKGIYDGAKEISEGTREYRRQMSFLELNSQNAGLDPNKVKDLAFEVASYTGSLDGAVEGMNNLIEAGLDFDEITLAAERFIGAIIKLPGLFNFEGLTEGLQESIATASPTGPYLELIERTAKEYGDVEKYIEDVNKSFKEAPHLEARQSVGLSWLSESGFEKAKKDWEAANQPLQEATEAQHLWNDELSRTGEIIEPIMTKIQKVTTWSLGQINDILSGEEPIDEKLVKVAENTGRWVDAIINSQDSDELKEHARIYWKSQKDIIVEQMKSTFGQEDNADFSAWQNFQNLLLQDTDTSPIGAKASEEFLQGMAEKLIEKRDEAGRTFELTGDDIINKMVSSLSLGREKAVSEVDQMMADIQASLNKPLVMPTINVKNMSNQNNGSSENNSNASNNSTLVMTLNEKVLGKVSSSSISDALGESVDRIETYG